MTYVRDGGQVIEFTGKRTRKNYDQAKKPEPEVQKASRAIVIAGRILQPLTAFIRRRFRIKSATISVTVYDDGGYALISTMQKTDDTMKVSLLSQAPPNKFFVCRG